MSEATPTGASGSNTHLNHSNTGRPYQSTVDQARAYAAELGPDLASAFDQLSDKTALILRAYIASVFQEGHSYSEIESVRDAMKQYFEDKFGCWGSSWKWLPDQDQAMVDGVVIKIEEQGEWIGNPVYDAEFVRLMQGLQVQDKKAKKTRQAKRRTAVGFDEVLQLKGDNFRFQEQEIGGPPQISVTVPFRTSNPIYPSQANVYEIYPQPDEPHACFVTKLTAWMQWLVQHKRRALQDDDLLFTQLPNEDELEQPCSVTQVSTLLNRYARDAGIMDHRYSRLDTHCLRRGGAQHRLIHVQDQWPLNSVKWWGGWSEREPAEKIVEYLLDNSQYEASFGNMMAPQGCETRGRTSIARLSAEVWAMRGSFESVIRSVESRYAVAMAKIEKEVQEIKKQNQDLYQAITGLGDVNTLHRSRGQHRPDSLQQQNVRQEDPPEPGVPPHEPSEEPQRLSEELEQLSEELHQLSEEIDQQSEELQHHSEGPQHYFEDSQQRFKELQHHFEQLHQQTEEPRHDLLLQSSLQHFLNPEPSSEFLPQQSPLPQLLPTPPQQQSLLVPTLQSFLPPQQPSPILPPQQQDIPFHLQHRSNHKIPAISDWKGAIRQWDEGEPELGLTVPLGQWTAEMAQQNLTYYNRKMIVREFEFFGRDEDRMREAHGDSMNLVSRLLESIRQRLKSQWQTPQDGRNEEGDRGLDGQSETIVNIEEVGDGDQPQAQSQQQQPQQVPIPKVFHWRDVIRQWDEGDPENGLLVPLRDWDSVMRTGNAMYYHRKTIVKEFEFFGRDADKMKEVYGDIMDRGVRKLLVAIHNRHKQQKAEEERKQSEARLAERGDGAEINQGEEAAAEQGPDNFPVVPRIYFWKQAIEQWEKGEPDRGLTVPMRDWPVEWRNSHKTSTVYKLYLTRKFIAEEFEFCGRDENRMRQLHGKNMEQIKTLQLSIRKRRIQAGKQKEAEALVDGGERDEDEDVETDELEVDAEDEPLIRKRKAITWDHDAYGGAGEDAESSSKRNKSPIVQNPSPLEQPRIRQGEPDSAMAAES
ncbi:hypothetical protein BG000_007145, partial [Podila horticola]